MAEKDIIMLSQEELKRLHIIRKLIEKKLKQAIAAGILNLTIRQIRRIRDRVKKEGDKGIVHKSRNRPSNRAFSQNIKDKVITLYRKKYPDFGPTLANEKLFEIDKIKIANQTLRNWLMASGSWTVTHRHKKYRQWRERKHSFGEMVQMDGSHHDWFEKRGPKCVLMGYIDDATNTVFARFYNYEGTMPAMDSLKRYMAKYGIPLSVYLDRHSTYKSTAKQSIDEQLNDVESLSHFEKALKELGVEVIHAQSPQAKGRIERLFKTFQDRLIKEMRLKGVSSISEANQFLGRYLPIYNRRFSKESIKPENLHRPVPKTINLEKVFRIKTERALRNDFTIAHENKLYQIKNNIRADKVLVEEKMSGSIEITHKGRVLRFKQILIKPSKKELTFKPAKVYIPPDDHPWKRPMYNSYLQNEKFAQKEKDLLLTTT